MYKEFKASVKPKDLIPVRFGTISNKISNKMATIVNGPDVDSALSDKSKFYLINFLSITFPYVYKQKPWA